ncbi:MAG: hypothetical protein KDC38_02490 [Planctomycetes bacterium]|nr:hypothetical protein [Planctomycetota bacterium]
MAGVDRLIREGLAPLQRPDDFAALAGVPVDSLVHPAEDTWVHVLVGDAVDQLEAVASRLETEFQRLLESHDSADLEQPVRVRTVLVQEEPSAGADDLRRTLLAEMLRRRSTFDLGSEIGALTSGVLTLKEAKTALEKRYITAELQKSRGNITRAAESLGVHRPQLSNLIKKHNVRREDFE